MRKAGGIVAFIEDLAAYRNAVSVKANFSFMFPRAQCRRGTDRTHRQRDVGARARTQKKR